MDSKYVLDRLEHISSLGSLLTGTGYDPARNIALMLHELQKLTRAIQDGINKESESK